jgi:hypothetical protein
MRSLLGAVFLAVQEPQLQNPQVTRLPLQLLRTRRARRVAFATS